MNENEKAVIEEVSNVSMSTSVLTSNILCHWPAEKIKRFALHLLGDNYQERAAKKSGEETEKQIAASAATNNGLNHDCGAPAKIHIQCQQCGYPIFIDGVPTEHAVISATY